MIAFLFAQQKGGEKAQYFLMEISMIAMRQEFKEAKDARGSVRRTSVFREVANCAQCILRAQEGMEIPDGFEPAWEMCYTDSYEMADAHKRQTDAAMNSGRLDAPTELE